MLFYPRRRVMVSSMLVLVNAKRVCVTASMCPWCKRHNIGSYVGMVRLINGVSSSWRNIQHQ